MKRTFMSFIASVLAILLSANCVFAQTLVNTDKYITLTVSQGDTIGFGILASANNTPIKIESGSWDTIIIAGTNTIFKKYKSQSTTMTIYGDVGGFSCYGNGSKLTALDVSHNTALIYLECDKNNLTSLDVSTLTNLISLSCDENQLISLDVSTLTNLVDLACSENQLTSLNISGCDSLKYIICYGNPLSTRAIDNLYCQLPDRTSQEQGEMVISLDSTDEIVLATNKTNATDKNWGVYWGDTTDYSIYEVVTNGTYVCGEEPSALANIEEQTITLYPNPAKDEIVLKGIKEMVTVFDANGRIVKQEVINERLDIKDLKSGVYYLQVRDITTKLIKQ